MCLRKYHKHTLAVVLLFTFTTYFSCKKSAEEAPTIITPEVSLITSLKSWMTDQKQTVSMNIQPRIDSLLATADWQKTIQTNVTNSKSVLYVPIRNSELGLEFFYDNSNKRIDSGNLVNIVNTTKKAVFANPKIVASKTYYETVLMGVPSSNPFSGVIHTYSISANFLYDYSFEEGKIISHGIVAPKQGHKTIKKANGLKITSQTCEEWGFFIIWEVGPPTLLYTFWVCSGLPDCPPISSLAISIGASKQYVGVNCAPPPGTGDGSSGGGTGQTEDCSFSKETAQSLLNSFETESLPYTGGLVFENEIIDSASGYSEKNWKPTSGYWNFFRAKLPGFFVINYGAFYRGKVFKNNISDQWKYKTVDYLYWEKLPGNLPTCFKIEMQVDNLGSKISTDQRSASSELHYKAILMVRCLMDLEIGDPYENTLSSDWGNPD